ncbi:MAG: Asp-tRNA(Asn)/Glu-tRNA(Gln) amidotransferase subunit GatC [Bifidobacteriaceae bacterium]|jgi:aspartyl-tRNA(Asn)/glutamyl-tRNA(Gln) amidotransferase subunit C|nr:Asp-tRNA(Asn)/Glu-tRNA(Gln) amidotransferase subunit GatC [Bifidobacteriaceae bacterium]
MSVITREDVARLGALARIHLTDGELDVLAGQLTAIVDAVAVVSSVVDDSTPATSHPIPLTNVFRPDVATPSMTRAEALSSAPAEQDGQFRVPRILGEEP